MLLVSLNFLLFSIWWFLFVQKRNSFLTIPCASQLFFTHIFFIMFFTPFWCACEHRCHNTHTYHRISHGSITNLEKMLQKVFWEKIAVLFRTYTTHEWGKMRWGYTILTIRSCSPNQYTNFKLGVCTSLNSVKQINRVNNKIK